VPLPCGKLQSCRGLGVNTEVALLACAAAFALTAQEAARVPRDLTLSSTLERIAAAPDGADAPAETAETADEVIVSVRFTNATSEIIDSIRITSPVPPDLKYVPQSASGPGSDVLFSVDHGMSFGRPDELTAVYPDGSVRSADPADYTHVRWTLRAPLDAGATGIARFRAVPR
jgi:hypothetical protein